MLQSLRAPAVWTRSSTLGGNISRSRLLVCRVMMSCVHTTGVKPCPAMCGQPFIDDAL